MQRLDCGLIELKFAGAEAEAMSFSGYGAVFGNVDSYGDVIEPGAFAQFLADAKSGKQAWPAMLLQHGGMGMSAEDMTPVGVWTSLAEDGNGLRVEGQLADTARARDLHALMKMTPRPAITGLSIGYIPKEWEPRSKADDPRRKLKRVDLVEISPVTFPSNGRALVDSVKSGRTIREAHKSLQDAGFSRREAKAILASGFKSLSDEQAAEDMGEELAALLRKNISLLRVGK